MNKTYMTIALLSPLACTAAMGAKKAKANNQQKPNVIIILADDWVMATWDAMVPGT